MNTPDYVVILVVLGILVALIGFDLWIRRRQ